MKNIILITLIFITIYSCVDNKHSVTDNLIDEPSLKILTPNGGEEFSQDSLIILSWEYSNVDSIVVSISYNGGISWETGFNDNIVEAVIGLVEIKNIRSTSDSCLFRIESLSDKNIFDISDSFFTINSSILR